MNKAGLTYGQFGMLLLATVMLLAGLRTEAQWLGGYTHRKEISLNQDQVSGDMPHTGFPCLVSVTDPLLRAEANGGVVQFADGRDICFTGPDKLSILDFEFESYDPVNGSLHAWVRFPLLSRSQPSSTYLYFGNPEAVPLWDTTAVWSNQYTAVWHMNNDPSGPDPQLLDATTYQNHGSTDGGMAPGDLRDGKIAGAVWFDGVDDYATMPVNGFNTEAGTVELWVNTDSIPTFWAHYIFAHRQQNPITDRVYVRYRTDSTWWTGMGNTMELAQGSRINTGTWYHFALSWNDTTVTGYLNGVQDIAPTPYFELDTVREIYIMTWMPGSESVTGRLDELRVSDVERDAAWIATSYANQSQPGLFFNIGEAVEGSLVANDLPCDAIVLPVRETCTFDTYTNEYSNDSGIGNPGCGNYQGGDVWFKLEVPASGRIEIQTYTEALAQYPDNDGWMYRPTMAIYSGDCDNLTRIECNSNNGSYHPRAAGTILTGLNPGDTLWVRIWEYMNNDIGMFDICVREIGLIPYEVSGGGSFCMGDSGTAVSLSGSDPGILYTLLINDTVRLDTLVGSGIPLTWSPVTNPGTYQVEAMTTGGGSVLMMNGSAEVQAFAVPQISATATDATCFGLDNGSIALSVIAQAPFVTEWTGPSGFTSLEEDLSGLGPGDYVVTVTDSNACTEISSPIHITEPPEMVTSIDSIIALTSYEARDGSVGITITGGIPPYQVRWTGTDNYESTEEDADNMSVGYYRVLVTDSHLCSVSMEGIRLIVEEDPDEIFIPESFSPNGDGYNDNFVILGIENFENNELMVFNRQGITVFYRANYQNDWDGTPEEGRVQGGELPEGTYYYIFKYGTNGIRKGFVYINR